MADTVTAAGYLVVEPASYFRGGGVATIKLSRVTQRYPQLQGNERAIKLAVRVPTSAFAPLAQVAIDVPEELVSAPDVTVEAG